MEKDIIKRIENIINIRNIDENEILFHLKNLVYEIELENLPVKESRTLEELFDESIKSLENNNGNPVFKSGYNNLDALIGGFSPGELVIFGSRPGMGKTLLLSNLAINISKNAPVLFLTYENSESVLTSRIISALSGISTNRILEKNITDEEKSRIISLGEVIKNHKILINDSIESSVAAFKASCLKHINENNIKIVIVDYIQLMRSKRYRNNRESEISYISGELKNFARENKICIIAASQLSRAVESRGGNKSPMLSDLRESGAIEQDADKVIFVYRPEYYGLSEDSDGNDSEGITELIIAKNRNGIIGTATLMRDADFTSLSDYNGHVNDFSFSLDRINELENPF